MICGKSIGMRGLSTPWEYRESLLQITGRVACKEKTV